MTAELSKILLFILTGLVMGAFALVLAYLVRAAARDDQKSLPYECGMEPVGNSFVSLDIRFYIMALLFVIFDVEALYILPWAVVFRDLGLAGLIEMGVFIGLLFLGLIYAWRKGALDWR